MSTSPGKWPFGAQVAAGFLIPLVGLALACVATALGSSLGGPLRRIASLVCSAAAVGLFFGSIVLAARKGWRGVLIGLVLFIALVALLVGACFAIVFLISKR